MLTDYKGNLVAPTPSFNQLQRDLFLHLVANLEGESDKTSQIQSFGITPSVFPQDEFILIAAKKIYEILLYFRREKIDPKRANIIRYLSGNDLAWLGERELATVVDEVLQKKTFDKQVIPIAAGLSEFVNRQKGIVASQAIAEVYSNPSIPNIEAYEQAVGFLQQARPDHRKRVTVSGMDLMDKWQKQMQENYELGKAGKVLGPRLPYKSTWNYLPFMRKGEMFMLFAQLKFGKTTLVANISEYVAYVLGGFNVLHVHLETSAMVMQSRMMARELLLPINDMERGFFVKDNRKYDLPLHEEPFLSGINRVRSFIKERENSHGRITYFHCPGASVAEIEAQVAVSIEEAKAEGRELLVVIDYYNKIDWIGYRGVNSEAAGLNRVAHDLKNAVESHDCFFLVVAQDDPDNDFSKDITVRGAREIAVVSQVLCRVERRVATEEDGRDEPMMIATDKMDINGYPIREQRKDALGNPMYYHRVGELDSLTHLNFVRSNNNAKGKSPIRIANAYFFVESVETKTIDLTK